MEVHPPYLFAGDGRAGPGVTVAGDPSSGVVELTVHGHWDRRLGLDVSTGMRKCLAEQPAALIANLNDLEDPDGASAAMWLALRRTCIGLRPLVQLALCVASDTGVARRLRRFGADRYVPMFRTLSATRAAVTSRLPLTDLLQIRLPPDADSPSLARDLVGQACHGWNLGDLLYPARRVLSELVINAIEHAGTDIVVTVSRRGAALHLSVRDGDPRPPRLLAGGSGEATGLGTERGQGLRLVHDIADAWGAMPTHDGKAVWATMGNHRNRRP